MIDNTARGSHFDVLCCLQHTFSRQITFATKLDITNSSIYTALNHHSAASSDIADTYISLFDL